MKRQYYIDNLRWIWIVILIPFHAAMAWNTWEGNYVWFQGSKVLSSFIIMICSFYMPLLFVLAGMSMNYALRKRSYRQFILERIKKLFVPLIAGIMTVVAAMTYFADKFNCGYNGNFFSHYSVFLTNIGDLSGYDGHFTPAHLWFMLFLFVISLLLLIVVMLQRKFLPNISFRRTKIWSLVLMVALVIVFIYVPDFGGKSVGESFALVTLGYYVFSEEEVIERICGYRYIFVMITFVSSCIYTVLFVWLGYHDSIVCSFATKVAEWFGILGFLGFGKSKLNMSNRFTRFMTVRSFPIYIFHFGWLVFLQYSLSHIIESTVILYTLSVIGTLILTLLTIEIIGRIPVLRSLFAIKIVRHSGN